MYYNFVPYYFPNNDNVTLSMGTYTVDDVPFIWGVPSAILDNFVSSDNTTDFPLELDVRSGVDYGFGAYEGTLDLPTAANVKIGVVFDGATTTGTYDGTDRHTSPIVSDVRILVEWKDNSLTNNKVGTMVSPTAIEVANQVWDTTLSGHTTVGTFGAFIQKILTVAKFLGLK
jgi:hypothetical protein